MADQVSRLKDEGKRAFVKGAHASAESYYSQA